MVFSRQYYDHQCLYNPDVGVRYRPCWQRKKTTAARDNPLKTCMVWKKVVKDQPSFHKIWRKKVKSENQKQEEGCGVEMARQEPKHFRRHLNLEWRKKVKLEFNNDHAMEEFVYIHDDDECQYPSEDELDRVKSVASSILQEENSDDIFATAVSFEYVEPDFILINS